MRSRVERCCVVVVLAAIVLTVVTALAAHDGVGANGQPVGADYAVFHDAGTALNRHLPLYDRRVQDDLYHRLAPGLPPSATLPFVYPPFVALPFRALAHLP